MWAEPSCLLSCACRLARCTPCGNAAQATHPLCVPVAVLQRAAISRILRAVSACGGAACTAAPPILLAPRSATGRLVRTTPWAATSGRVSRQTSRQVRSVWHQGVGPPAKVCAGLAAYTAAAAYGEAFDGLVFLCSTLCSQKRRRRASSTTKAQNQAPRRLTAGKSGGAAGPLGRANCLLWRHLLDRAAAPMHPPRTTAGSCSPCRCLFYAALCSCFWAAPKRRCRCHDAPKSATCAANAPRWRGANRAAPASEDTA